MRHPRNGWASIKNTNLFFPLHTHTFYSLSNHTLVFSHTHWRVNNTGKKKSQAWVRRDCGHFPVSPFNLHVISHKHAHKFACSPEKSTRPRKPRRRPNIITGSYSARSGKTMMRWWMCGYEITGMRNRIQTIQSGCMHTWVRVHYVLLWGPGLL